MKNASHLFISALVVFAIVFTLSNTTVAQEAFESSKTGLEAQMQELIKVQGDLVKEQSNFFKSFIPTINSQDEGDINKTTSLFEQPPKKCGGNYLNWPSSSTWKDAPWSPLEIDFEFNTWKTFAGDLNGDGLIDFAYHYPASVACVWLNNGAGWDIAYQCKMVNDGGWIFYGDCADTEA